MSEPTRRLGRIDRVRRLNDEPTASARRSDVRGMHGARSGALRPAQSNNDWFADEIAIDFPSVGAVVDRIRDAFLAPDEEPPALSTEISLSALDAFTGTVVPIDLPVRGTCQACGGRGETWTEPCGPCRGSGEAMFTHPVQVSVPPRVADGARIRLQVSGPHAPPTRIDVRVTINQ